MVLLEELTQHGCQVEFLERPMSDDPHDQLLLQIRGAVAEYERTLIADRMRRGRQAKIRSGLLLPWTEPSTARPRQSGGGHAHLCLVYRAADAQHALWRRQTAQ